MVVSLEYELITFLSSVLLAILVGIVYDFFRALRKLFKMTVLWDTLMWITVLVLVVCVWFFVQNGEVRWYTILGAVSSGIIYFFSFSKCVFFVFDFAIGKIYAFFCIIFKILLTPPRFLCRIIGVYINEARLKFPKKVEEENDEKNV